MKTKNAMPLASITAKYIGATERRGSVIQVKSQRGRKSYPYPHELSGGEVYASCVSLYLENLVEQDRKFYGDKAEGWGELSDFSHGVLPSGEHVFVRN